MTEDARREAPAVARNRDPILAVLRRYLPARGLVVEIASGSGEHIRHFAAALPLLAFQPSDPDPGCRASIDAWAVAQPNIHPALALDAASPWPIARADAVLCINMVHISPWAATIGLFRHAGAILPPGGLLYLYGPYRQPGLPTASSNEAFDASLRARDPAWGLRDLSAVTELALRHGFVAPVVETMPANNLSLVFRRAAAQDATS